MRPSIALTYILGAATSTLFVHAPYPACGETSVQKIFAEHSNGRAAGQPSVCSEAQFKRKFDAFSHRQLRHVDWRHVAVIGGAVTACLMPGEECGAGFESSDIDICLFRRDSSICSDPNSTDANDDDHDELDVSTKLKQLYEAIVRAEPSVAVHVISTREAVTFARGYPYRHIQVLGVFEHMDEIVRGIDVDCNAVCFDGRAVHAAPRACLALNLRLNTVDVRLYGVRGCPAFECRLLKYARRGFR